MNILNKFSKARQFQPVLCDSDIEAVEEQQREIAYRTLEVRRALKKNEFILHYQPQINLADGSLLNAKALLRWQHPHKGLLRPDQFFSQVDQVGMGHAVGYRAIHCALQAMQEMDAIGLRRITLTLPLTLAQLQDRDFDRKVSLWLDEHEVSGSRVVFELPASAWAQLGGETSECLQQLRGRGVTYVWGGTEIDQPLPENCDGIVPQVVKLNRRVVQQMTAEHAEAEPVIDLIKRAHARALTVVAEGVETAEQARKLQQGGCDRLQGNHVKPPVNFEQLCALLFDGGSLASGL